MAKPKPCSNQFPPDSALFAVVQRAIGLAYQLDLLKIPWMELRIDYDEAKQGLEGIGKVNLGPWPGVPGLAVHLTDAYWDDVLAICEAKEHPSRAGDAIFADVIRGAVKVSVMRRVDPS